MLSVDEVAFAYPNGIPVLTGVTFAAERGDVVAIVGRNGAGKSTLLRLINGLLTPTSGRVTVNGKSTATTPVHALATDVGTVFQAPEQQIFNVTVRDEIAFGPRQIGLRGETLRTRVAHTLERTGLTAVAQTHPLDLDAATLRLVALASVLAMKPAMLLLDEPQRGLDATALARLEAIIVEEAAAGTGVVIVCHDMDFVARRADRVVSVAAGRIADDRATGAFFADAGPAARAGVERPDAIVLAEALGLAPALSASALARSWLARFATP
jgi:energy-coupling factor transport system ATP-binding protein